MIMRWLLLGAVALALSGATAPKILITQLTYSGYAYFGHLEPAAEAPGKRLFQLCGRLGWRTIPKEAALKTPVQPPPDCTLFAGHGTINAGSGGGGGVYAFTAIVAIAPQEVIELFETSGVECVVETTEASPTIVNHMADANGRSSMRVQSRSPGMYAVILGAKALSGVDPVTLRYEFYRGCGEVVYQHLTANPAVQEAPPSLTHDSELDKVCFALSALRRRYGISSYVARILAHDIARLRPTSSKELQLLRNRTDVNRCLYAPLAAHFTEPMDEMPPTQPGFP